MYRKFVFLLIAAPMVWTAPGVAASEPIAKRLAAADLQKGERLLRRFCAAACHTFTEEGRHRVGPNLWDVVGKPMAAKPKARYSRALKKRAAKGGIWDYAALDAYIEAPRRFLPGGTMSFVGLKRAEDRAAVILYLRSLSDDPPPLPAAP